MSAASIVELASDLVAARWAGGKAVGLASLAGAGLRIPRTWVVPVGGALRYGDLDRLAEIAPRWAVRSSATIEDGTSLSYAGMFSTELDVPVARLPEAVVAVRESARDPRVRAYRARVGASDTAIDMAVLLQPFQPPEQAGLWLGRGSDAGRLEWVTGSGEALVSGAVTPAWEEWSAHGLVDAARPRPLGGTAAPVGASCLRAQRLLGFPADLEFALLGTELVWLQCRPMTRALTEPVATAEDTRSVRGVAAAPGRATGRGVLLHDAADPRWAPGTVLLAERTDPDWLPLMVEAAALVTGAGGMLCHTAIVARELGIPCVTGIGGAALSRLAGGRLAVDGTEGTVSIAD